MKSTLARLSCGVALSVGLMAASARAQANVAIDASSVVRTVDNRMFGLNTAVWDYSFSDAQTLASLRAVDARFLRYPGGSTSDDYHWQTNTDDDTGANAGGTNFDAFAAQAVATGAQVVVTVNYGTGTPAEAAAWVADSNVTKGYGFKYWEIGNECYGTWEDDKQAIPHDAATYATRAVAYIQAMKAADPTIKIGVCADDSEDSYNAANTTAVTNPVTGKSHTGWTPVLLATMKGLGVLPDFLIFHHYEQNSGSENDTTLLQYAKYWPSYATELRMQLTDYLGTAGGAVELLVTENNSVNTNPGKQTTSLVNGLYLADSVGNLMQTEFNSLIWWDLHNSPDAGNNNAASLYGWRQYGDYGIENGDGTSLAPAHDPYPTYYAMKLLTHFARGGDSVVKATSDNTLLSVFAAKRADGTLSILVINKDPKNTLSGNFTLTGYAPQPTAAVYTYGMVQDTAAQTGSGSSDLAVTSISSAGTSFAASFSPYSLTVLSLSVPSNSPTATSQPASQTVAAGATVVFGFAASGSPLPTYQWFLNGSAVSGATGSTLVVHGAGSADAGTYTAVATNSSGSVTSSPATLAVVTTANPGRLVNLSCRADAGTGANIIVAGFAVGGAGTSGSENLLIRASGPAIAGAPFNVAGTLPDPQLELFNGAGTLTNTNEGWGGSSLISSTAAAVGAFAWSNPSSHDAAFLMPLAAGTYSTQIAGQSGDTGVAIVEVYDATPAGTYTAATPRLVNLSARVNVGTGANILVAGFAIGGTTSRTVLIRASGPAIAVAPFNVGGTLPDPQLTLMNQNTGAVIATNSGWGGDATIAATASSVGAFGWGSPTSKDSALLVTLPPGTYGAQVVGASGDTGVAIVEIYEVP